MLFENDNNSFDLDVNSSDSTGRKPKGSSDVLSFFFKAMATVITVFALFYFLMSDLKVSESKKITRSFLQVAQENIRILEKTGFSMNNYLASKASDLDPEDSSLVWNIVSKSHSVDTMLWYVSNDTKWRHMSNDMEYTIMEYPVSTKTPELKKLLRHISEFPKDISILNMHQLNDAFSIYVMSDFSKMKNSVPWLFAHKNLRGGYDFLFLLSNIKELFFDEDSNLLMHEITLRNPNDENSLFHYSYKNKKNRGFFLRPLDLEYGLTMAGESWIVDMKVDPTRAYIIFAILPWILLLMGLAFVVSMGVYLHRQYRNENQLAHISETLADKNTELLNWEHEKKKMIKKFRKSEWEYRAIINAVSDIIFEIDQNGRFVFLNDTWESLTGSKNEERLGKSLFDYLHPDEVSYHMDLFQEFISGYRSAYKREARFKLSENKYHFVEIGFSMMRLSDNEPRVVGTVTDIGKRKQAELAHKSAEQKYTEMFKNALNGIYQVTPEGLFISINKAFADILGYETSEELIDSVTDMGKEIYAEPKQRAFLEMQLTQQGVMTGIESEVYRKDGTRIWILENLRTIYDNKGAVDYFEGTVWDVTKRRETDFALRTAKVEAELTSRARIEFMANMSHELRTPLNAVIGFSEIIRNEVMGPIEQDVYKEYANDIHDSGKQLLSIINDILELSQIEIGERELKESEFPLLRVVKSVMELLSHKIKRARVEIIVDIPEDLPRIFAEEVSFKQIMMNILSNSIKFTPEEGCITVTVALDSDSSLIVEITDTGIGMTDKEAEKALQPFGQVEAEMDRDNSGTGLGLSIVQALVELHQGRFMLVSQKDVGTTIKMVFPKERVMMRSIPKI